MRSVLRWSVYGPCDNQLETRHFLAHHYSVAEQNCSLISDQKLNELKRKRIILDETAAQTDFIPDPTDQARTKEILQQTTDREGMRLATDMK